MVEVQFPVRSGGEEVSVLISAPPDAMCMLVMAHGAGAGMRHPSMETLSRRLGDAGIATYRYQFPYMERGTRLPDAQPVLISTVRAAVEAAAHHAPQLPLFAGGRSMGGRMTSLAAAETPLAPARGIIFFGFPLHPSGRPGTSRASHLHNVVSPMLFLQGTRDTLADLELVRAVCSNLGSRATLHVLDGADHSFHVLKRSGRTDDDVMGEIVLQVRRWIDAELQRTVQDR